MPEADGGGVLHLACSADRRYLAHAATMLRSALAANPDLCLHIHLLHGPSLPRRGRSRLEEMVKRAGGAISSVAIADDLVEDLPLMSEISAAMWYRIYLPELLPSVSRLLYLDVDTIVMDGLRPLLEADLTGCFLGAVSNVWPPWMVGHPARLGLPAEQDYFNSGVLLMNLELMRSEGMTQRLREFARAHRDALTFPDQDTLNLVLGGRRRHLHPRWNTMNSVLQFPAAAEQFGAEAVAEARRAPAIRHFEGPASNKPWHLLCESEHREAYRRHRRHTPWPVYVPAGMSPRSLAQRALRGRRGVRVRGAA